MTIDRKCFSWHCPEMNGKVICLINMTILYTNFWLVLLIKSVSRHHLCPCQSCMLSPSHSQYSDIMGLFEVPLFSIWPKFCSLFIIVYLHLQSENKFRLAHFMLIEIDDSRFFLGQLIVMTAWLAGPSSGNVPIH